MEAASYPDAELELSGALGSFLDVLGVLFCGGFCFVFYLSHP